jgi:hypothetical protein
MLAHVALIVTSETGISQMTQNSRQTLVYNTIYAYICHIRSAVATSSLIVRNARNAVEQPDRRCRIGGARLGRLFVVTSGVT